MDSVLWVGLLAAGSPLVAILVSRVASRTDREAAREDRAADDTAALIRALQAECERHITENSGLVGGIERRNDDIERWRDLHDKLKVITARREFTVFMLRRDRAEVLKAMLELRELLTAGSHESQIVEMVIARLTLEVEVP